MTDRDAEQEAREIVSLYVHNHGRHGEPLSCPSCKKLCAIIAAAFQRRDDELARLRNDLLDALDLKEGYGPTVISMLAAERDALKAQRGAVQGRHTCFQAHPNTPCPLIGLDEYNRQLAAARREIERLRGITEAHLMALRDAEAHMKTQATETERQQEALADAPDTTCESLDAGA